MPLAVPVVLVIVPPSCCHSMYSMPVTAPFSPTTTRLATAWGITVAPACWASERVTVPSYLA